MTELKEVTKRNDGRKMTYEEIKKDCLMLCGVCAKSYCPKIEENQVIPQNGAGTLRSNKKGLGRPTLMPSEALIRDSKWFEGGIEKHGARNWEKGLSYESCLDSVFRHWCKYKDGSTDEDHLAAIRWNCAAIMHFEKYHPEFDDRPKEKKQEEGNRL